jgi:hypothetical protein
MGIGKYVLLRACLQLSNLHVSLFLLPVAYCLLPIVPPLSPQLSAGRFVRGGSASSLRPLVQLAF